MGYVRGLNIAVAFFSLIKPIVHNRLYKYTTSEKIKVSSHYKFIAIMKKRVLVTYNMFRAGYAELIEKFDVTFPPEGRESFTYEEVLDMI